MPGPLDAIIPPTKELWAKLTEVAVASGVDPRELHGGNRMQPPPPPDHTPAQVEGWPEPSRHYRRSSLNGILDPDLLQSAHLYPVNAAGDLNREQLNCIANALLLVVMGARATATGDEETRASSLTALSNEMHLFQIVGEVIASRRRR